MSTGGAQTTPRVRFKPYSAYKDSGVEWLGEIPAYWRWQRLRHTCKKITDGSHQSPPAVIDGQPYVTVRDLVDGKVDVDNAARISENDFRSLERNGCRPQIGDVLFSKDGSVGKVALVERNDFVVLSSLAILRPGPDTLSPYLAYFLSSASGVSQIASRFAGAALRRITLDVIVDLITSIPPKEEQRAIAAFLDRQTARIDALVAKKERLIELLQEKRTALITQAVTKGIDLKVPMKDSGVVWVGSIPAHWELRRCATLFSLFSGYAFKSEFFSRESEDAPILVTPGNFHPNGGLYFTQENTTHYSGDFAPGFALKVGDWLIVMTDLSYKRLILGKCVKVDRDRLLLNQRVARIIPTQKANSTHPEFLAYALNSDAVREQVMLSTTGATVFHSSPEKIRQCWIARPPLKEQQKISAYLDRETTKLDALIAKVSEGIERLNEYRTALISASVTGKIDVREEDA
jgi:type I restriction enzyme S subunit